MTSEDSEALGNEMAARIRDLIAKNTSEAPREPGLYRLPCGDCYVDFFVSAEGDEHWTVPGDATLHTRDTIAIARHGDYPWTRLRTLSESANVIQEQLKSGISLPALIERLEAQERPEVVNGNDRGDVR